MSEYEGKYFFIKNVRTSNDLSSEMLGYDTTKEAEINYHDEVSYGLKLDNIELAHYIVVNEYGVKVDNLEKIIDNMPPVENENVEE